MAAENFTSPKNKPENKLKKAVNKHFNWSYLNILREFPILFDIQARYGKKKLKDGKPKSILIINSSLIGDFVNSLPALNYFLKKNDGAVIDLIVAPPLLSLSKNIRGVRNVAAMKTIFQKGGKEVIPQEIAGIEYDLVLLMRIPVNIQKLLKKITFSEIRTYLYVYLRLGLTIFQNNSPKNVVKQIRKINFEIIGENDYDSRHLKYDDIFLFTEDEKNMSNLPDFYESIKHTKKVVIHTGSGWEIKFWSVKKWVSLLNEMNSIGGFSFIFIGANKQEEEYFDKIKSEINFPVYSIIKSFDIKNTMLFLLKCDYFIGVDSGPRHLAHLLDMPSISLLGPGPKSFEPLNECGLVIDKASKCVCTNVACLMMETCLELITVEEVLDLVRKNWT